MNAALDPIDEVFVNVTQSLISEGISEESFRTFNEAYKSVRGAIDRMPTR